MAHYAKIDENNIVIEVLKFDDSTAEELINSGLFGEPSTWIQTSYNTRAGLHYGPDGNPDGGIALRKNYACIGFTYDSTRDAFIPPVPVKSPTTNTGIPGVPSEDYYLDETSCTWKLKVPYPDVSTSGKMYDWDSTSKQWVNERDNPNATRVTR